MSINAYILLNVEPGQSGAATAALRKLHCVVSAERVTGPYDIICLVEEENLDKLGATVRNSIQALPHVKRAMSCLHLV